MNKKLLSVVLIICFMGVALSSGCVEEDDTPLEPVPGGPSSNSIQTITLPCFLSYDADREKVVMDVTQMSSEQIREFFNTFSKAYYGYKHNDYCSYSSDFGLDFEFKSDTIYTSMENYEKNLTTIYDHSFSTSTYNMEDYKKIVSVGSKTYLKYKRVEHFAVSKVIDAKSLGELEQKVEDYNGTFYSEDVQVIKHYNGEVVYRIVTGVTEWNEGVYSLAYHQITKIYFMPYNANYVNYKDSNSTNEGVIN